MSGEFSLDNLDAALGIPPDCGVCSSHPAMQDPLHWSIGPIIRTRDSDLLDESNADMLIAALKEAAETVPFDSWEEHRFSHWAVGWVDHLSFKVKNEDGTPTPVAVFLSEWFAALSTYPVADDEDLSRREYEATLENIGEAGRRKLIEDAPVGWETQVWEWLNTHDYRSLDPRDGGGGYPSDESMEKALRALELWDTTDDAYLLYRRTLHGKR